MTGPEHYRAAEALPRASQMPADDGYDAELYPEVERLGDAVVDTVSNSLRAAQVHATLALAAAQAPVVNTMQQHETLGHAWAEAVSS